MTFQTNILVLNAALEEGSWQEF
nr:hypothetical protein [Xanthomonas oryzae]